MGKEILTYDDLLQIVELIKSAESFSEFHLKIGDIELDLRKSDGSAAAPLTATASTALPAADAAASAKLAPGGADQIAAAAARAAVEPSRNARRPSVPEFGNCRSFGTNLQHLA